MKRPRKSPMGEIENCKTIYEGTMGVTHKYSDFGGIMIRNDVVERLLPEAALHYGEEFNGYLCYMGPIKVAIVLYEYLRRGYIEAPVNSYYAEGEFELAMKRILHNHFPSYWRYQYGGEIEQ